MKVDLYKIYQEFMEVLQEVADAMVYRTKAIRVMLGKTLLTVRLVSCS